MEPLPLFESPGLRVIRKFHIKLAPLALNTDSNFKGTKSIIMTQRQKISLIFPQKRVAAWVARLCDG